LPRGYREFLLQVGAGCGPYYGIWSPSEVLAEWQSISTEDNGQPGRSPSEKFPLTAAETQIQNRDWPTGGCIPIGHQGCTFWSVLVLEGAFTGKVWDVACFVGTDGEWLPARRPTGLIGFEQSQPEELPALNSPPLFVEWVEGWIDRCVSDLTVRG